MTAALRLATRRALDQLPPDLVPDAVVLDGTFDFVSPPAGRSSSTLDGAVEPDAGRDRARRGRRRPSWAPPVQTVIGGDARCASVAAASVLAKVTRDRIMRADARLATRPSTSSGTRAIRRPRTSGPCAATG